MRPANAIRNYTNSWAGFAKAGNRRGSSPGSPLCANPFACASSSRASGLLEFAKGNEGGPYALGETAEGAGILFEAVDTCVGAQGKYVLYAKGSGGVGRPAGMSIDACGTCVLRDSKSPTELTCCCAIILKARDRPRAAARSARVAAGGDVASEGAGKRAGPLC